MSSYANTNNGPPMVNGMSPVQQMQQQPPQQQHQQMQQNQQNIGLRSMLPVVNTNINKFMPPPSNVPASYPTTSIANYGLQNLNGTQTNQVLQHQLQSSISNNMSPNLRPPIINGPGSGNNLIMNGASTNTTVIGSSSRTSSPAIQLLNQQQQEVKPSGLSTQPPTSATALSKESNVNSLTGHIQNLNINQVNGPMPPTLQSSKSLQMPIKNEVPTTTPQQTANNFQVIFTFIICYMFLKINFKLRRIVKLFRR